MPAADPLIVDEVEEAVRKGSHGSGLETLKRAADLFLSSAGSYGSEQVELFDNVFERLIKTIEIRAVADISARIALAEFSEQLSHTSQAPPSTVRRLARNDEISIAEPVLKESACLTAADLVDLAHHKSERHVLAIASRWQLKEVVTDALLARGYPSVSRQIVNNPGAKISAAGFAIVVAQAESDPELAVQTGIRIDLPSELRDQLVRKATEAVRTRLLSRAPSHLFEEIRRAIDVAAASANRDMSKVYDFSEAKRVVASLENKGMLDEHALRAFAQRRKYEETIVALAQLSRSRVEVVRPLMQSLRDDGILVPCKVAQVCWETVSAILQCRYAGGSMSSLELIKAQDGFNGMKLEKARQLLQHWHVRISSLN
jgi:uncharacterized protein (DUF2336 family)